MIRTTVIRATVTLVTAVILLNPGQLHGQVFGGVFGARAHDAFGGSTGFGVEGGLSIPVLPLDVFGSGEWFFPSCTGCDLSGWSLGVKYRVFPFPVVRPYVTGGRTWRSQSVGVISAVDDEGMFGGFGADVVLPGFRLFGEIRYDFLSGDLEQRVARTGFLLSWGGLPRD